MHRDGIGAVKILHWLGRNGVIAFFVIVGGHDLSRFGGLFLIIWSDFFPGSMDFSQAAGSGKEGQWQRA